MSGFPIVARRPGADPFSRRMKALTELTPQEVIFLEDMATFARRFPSGVDIRDGARSGLCKILLSGWACRYVVLPDGRRQIIGFVLPGEAFGALHKLLIPISSRSNSLTTVVSLTPVEVVDGSKLNDVVEQRGHRCPGILRAVQEMAMAERMHLYDHIVRLGRQTAPERMLHLLLEFHGRLRLAGLGDPGGYRLPLTQEVLADSTGISTVHANRVLQQLRRDRLIEIRHGRLSILDYTRAQEIAGCLLVAAPAPLRSQRPDA